MVLSLRRSLTRSLWHLFPAAFLAAVFLSPARAGDLLFEADFAGDPVGAFPTSDWNPASAGTNYVAGSVQVREDTNEWFGKGKEARYLRARDGQHFTLRGQLSRASDVVVLRFSFVGRNTPNDNRWVHFNFLAGNGNQRAHILSLALTSRTIRGPGVSYGENGELIRFSVVMNNGAQAVSYTGPAGEERVLAAERADVWANGELKASNTSFGRDGGTGPIQAVSIQADSTSVVSFDLAGFEVLDGAVVDAEPIPTPPPPMATLGPDGRLSYTKDIKGNRIPDFSNAGYMGGGVPIPEVPVRATLYPESGDDRARIQAAIDFLSGMPLDEHGFRGALLLKAGAYHISNTLRIQASGVVLRGEGDGPDGTVLYATGAFQHDLIEVFGSGGQWLEVSGSRRDIIDSYVPVGARSFQVTSADGYEVGDTIIVYRPSTAEWISAIGMDEIPERSDGLPITQWTAGSRDLRYDRVITAIDGNRITVDAPLVNALEEEFGGGYIFRYTFPGRISQVGVEHLRAVSVYQGGPWTTSQFDEEHAWTFVVFNRVQNAWVRNTTALHFSFGNTHILSLAKWVTVQDSQNLLPVSTISGSRRYPFYIQGQLSLVQRCYANYARHDYGTSSLTHGPNVFLDSRGDFSYSDTGPHHRWATGALYDNIHIPNRDIAIQNRLNFGSGHGWAGANHVVWNSSANRIVVQNPPTAQNWAIGVIGTKWAGAFPDYAEDGYWISHGTRVEPESLYLKQLEDRLAPEGTGGAIATVSFEPDAAAQLSPGAVVEFPVTRLGIRDGMTRVRFVLLGEGAEFIDGPDEIQIPAHQSGGILVLQLREGSFRPSETTVEVRLVHDAGYSVGVNSTATLTIPPDPFHSWQAAHFSTAQLDDPLISGSGATPAGDGVENLLKYALNLSPFQPVGAGDLPSLEIEEGRLTLRFLRGELRGDLDYIVEVSSDLVTWHSGPAFTEEVGVSGTGDWKVVTVADRVAISGESRRFMRLRVEWAAQEP